MSYGILIFEPNAVTDENFPQWWEQISRWEESRDYDATEGSTLVIRTFYRDLIRTSPPFNDPSALSSAKLEEREEQGLSVADYTIGTDYIYVGVDWSDANALVKIIGQVA